MHFSYCMMPKLTFVKVTDFSLVFILIYLEYGKSVHCVLYMHPIP